MFASKASYVYKKIVFCSKKFLIFRKSNLNFCAKIIFFIFFLQKQPYPKSVWFIVGNEFCERFSYYGMKTVLALYLKQKLHFDEDYSTVIYHAFSGLCYTTPIFGAMLADQFFGKYRFVYRVSKRVLNLVLSNITKLKKVR